MSEHSKSGWRWVWVSVLIALCVTSAALFIFLDGPEHIARGQHGERARHEHEAFISKISIPTAEYANELPELDSARLAVWIHISSERLHIETSALAERIYATRSNLFDFSALPTDFTLTFDEGGWVHDLDSEESPYNLLLIDFIQHSLYKSLRSMEVISQVDFYLVVDEHTPLETLTLSMMSLRQVLTSPVYFVLRNPHVAERLHLLRYDGPRCCASPNAPDLELPAIAAHFCAQMKTTIERAHTSILLRPVPFEERWGVPFFSIDSERRVYDRHVYIDEQGMWHQGGILGQLAGDPDPASLALPGEPHHDFLPIALLPDRQDIYSASPRRFDDAYVRKLYAHRALEGNFCKEAHLLSYVGMNWSEVLPIYTAMTVGQHGRAGGLVRFLMLFPEPHDEDAQAKPFVHTLTLDEATHRLERWRGTTR